MSSHHIVVHILHLTFFINPLRVVILPGYQRRMKFGFLLSFPRFVETNF